MPGRNVRDHWPALGAFLSTWVANPRVAYGRHANDTQHFDLRYALAAGAGAPALRGRNGIAVSRACGRRSAAAAIVIKIDDADRSVDGGRRRLRGAGGERNFLA